MQCAIQHWLPEQKKEHQWESWGNPNKVWCLINRAPMSFLSCDKCTMVMEDVNIRGKRKRGIRELSANYPRNFSGNLKLLQNDKNYTSSIILEHFIPAPLHREMKTYVHTNTCTALFVIAPNWKLHSSPSTGEWWKQSRHIPPWYSAMKKMELLIPTTTRGNLPRIMLSEKCQSSKVVYWVTPFI